MQKYPFVWNVLCCIKFFDDIQEVIFRAENIFIATFFMYPQQQQIPYAYLADDQNIEAKTKWLLFANRRIKRIFMRETCGIRLEMSLKCD